MIIENLKGALSTSLTRQHAVVYGCDHEIEVPNGRTLHADVVVCIAPNIGDDAIPLFQPAIVFEVLSDSTEVYERSKKFEYYQSSPSLQEYVLVAQDRPHVDHFVRQVDGVWGLRMIDGMESVLRLPTVECELAFGAIYDRVTFLTGQTLEVASNDRTGTHEALDR